jgi:serine/threonine protein phosphatase PrpC
MGDFSPRYHRILRVDIGLATQMGRRAKNEDYVAACLGRPDASGKKIVAAVADGLGGYKGGREASKTAVRAFIDSFYNFPQLSVMQAVSRSLDAINGWIAAQRRVDPDLAGMAAIFTALILAGRSGHVAHVGDTRAYRLSQGRLQQLTNDHTIDTGEDALALSRAMGFEAAVRVDHMAFALQAQDRFLLCSDGVHGVLNPSQLKAFLASERLSQTAADEIVAAAMKGGSTDNISAIVVDILDLPLVNERDLVRRLAALPIAAAPEQGEIIDNFRLDEIIADKSEVRVFSAFDLATGERVVLSFPHRCAADEEAPRRSAFVSEAWAASRARSPWIGEIIEIDPARQTRLYSAVAADEWGAPPRVKTVLPSRPDSWERVLLHAGHARYLTQTPHWLRICHAAGWSVDWRDLPAARERAPGAIILRGICRGNSVPWSGLRKLGGPSAGGRSRRRRA